MADKTTIMDLFTKMTGETLGQDPQGGQIDALDQMKALAGTQGGRETLGALGATSGLSIENMTPQELFQFDNKAVLASNGSLTDDEMHDFYEDAKEQALGGIGSYADAREQGMSYTEWNEMRESSLEALGTEDEFASKVEAYGSVVAQEQEKHPELNGIERTQAVHEANDIDFGREFVGEPAAERIQAEYVEAAKDDAGVTRQQQDAGDTVTIPREQYEQLMQGQQGAQQSVSMASAVMPNRGGMAMLGMSGGMPWLMPGGDALNAGLAVANAVNANAMFNKIVADAETTQSATEEVQEAVNSVEVPSANVEGQMHLA